KALLHVVPPHQQEHELSEHSQRIRRPKRERGDGPASKSKRRNDAGKEVTQALRARDLRTQHARFEAAVKEQVRHRKMRIIDGMRAVKCDEANGQLRAIETEQALKQKAQRQ